jgi:NTP pyrophosphatase (non-canonical NTP hydrolase)
MENPEPTDMLTLRQLQAEVWVWSRYNFGDVPRQPSWAVLLGVGEEVGELARAHLKQVQGIRGYDNTNFAQFRKEDAIGDAIIFLADYCAREGLDLQRAVELTWAKVSQRNWAADPAQGGQ